MKQIEEYQRDNDRWVEIPNDFEDISIRDFDQMMMYSAKPSEKNDVFELGVEIYDEINQKWPFRDNVFVSSKHSHEILEDGEYQIIASHSNKALMQFWTR